ncbi:MAG: hypothetical protein WA708_05485 [Acidobacteriaceae bacterium]
MAGFDSIAEMMQSYAADAVRIAGERFGFALDYSDESVKSLETILSTTASGLNPSDSGAVEREVKLWGAYLGEVVRKRWDGAWDLTSYPGRVAAVPTLIVAGSQLYPLMKVYRRLTMGEAENVWMFYEKIRGRLCAVYPIDGPAN